MYYTTNPTTIPTLFPMIGASHNREREYVFGKKKYPFRTNSNRCNKRCIEYAMKKAHIPCYISDKAYDCDGHDISKTNIAIFATKLFFANDDKICKDYSEAVHEYWVNHPIEYLKNTWQTNAVCNKAFTKSEIFHIIQAGLKSNIEDIRIHSGNLMKVYNDMIFKENKLYNISIFVESKLHGSTSYYISSEI